LLAQSHKNPLVKVQLTEYKNQHMSAGFV